MYLFGIELECFQVDYAGQVVIPHKSLPTDGFPGLVEFRSNPRDDLFDACAEVRAQIRKFLQKDFSFKCLDSHTFARTDLAELRKRASFKRQCNIRNLYNKSPRKLGNKTIASLQINISKQLSPKYNRNIDGKSIEFPERYAQMDVPAIVRALDNEFVTEIVLSQRQAGEYCIKDDVRLEYRSLPSSAWNLDALETRVLRALEGVD